MVSILPLIPEDTYHNLILLLKSHLSLEPPAENSSAHATPFLWDVPISAVAPDYPRYAESLYLKKTLWEGGDKFMGTRS